MTKWHFIENIAVIFLAGFLCWLFKSGWGCIVLLWLNYQRKKQD